MVIKRLFAAILAFAVAFSIATTADAQTSGAGPSALARFQSGAVTDRLFGATRLDMQLSQGVPWRVFTQADPDRVILDFKEVDFADADPMAFDKSARIASVRFGPLRPGWSRLIAELETPMQIDQAGLEIDPSSGQAALVLEMSKTDRPTFLGAANPPLAEGWSLPEPVALQRIERDANAPLIVILDPGHGGLDPGAQNSGISESDLMLTFARELRDVLVRAGGYQVYLTRDSDHFVSLEGRVSVAHRLSADLFISLHADSLAAGSASGAAIYTLSEDASDKASAALAERHNREDLLIGLDLSHSDDQVAQVLLDLARLDNTPRSKAAAKHVLAGIQNAVGEVHKHPLREAGFSVLKSADIPSILIELGFLSTDADLNNLQDPAWRAGMAAGIRDGVSAWALEDAALSRLRRQ